VKGSLLPSLKVAIIGLINIMYSTIFIKYIDVLNNSSAKG
jgi:hypothetical protein